MGAEAELLVERVRIPRVEDPAAAGIRPVLDDLPDELDAQSVAAVLVEDVDVREVDEPRGVAVDRPREADLVAVLVEPDDVAARVDQLVLAPARPPLRPVRGREEGVDRLPVEPRAVVVELVAVFE